MKLNFKYILLFYNSMFADRDAVVRGKRFPLGKMKGLRNYRVGNLLFIEQNPRKESKWADLSKEGVKIMWVIDTKRNKYLYRVQNGRVYRL